MLVDSHCHLDFPDFAEERDEIVARAGRAGVARMLTIGTHISRFDGVRSIAEAYPNVWCTVGIHPHEAGGEEVAADRLIELSNHAKVVGFGETGLDYFYDHSPRQAQRARFRTHIEAARRAGLPVVIHTRDADDDLRAIIAEEMAQGAFTGLIHCFSGGPELAEFAIDMGLYISVSGIVTFNKAEALRRTLAAVPLDRLLVETDAPYLAPVPKRGKRNEPAFVAHTAARLAEVKGVPVAELAEATTANFLRLFTKVPA